MMAHAHVSLLFTISIVCFSLVAGEFAGSPAQRVPQLLQLRATFNGGFSLAAQTCPAGTTQCALSGYCCPSSTVCRSLSGAWACCPDTSNCATQVKTFPVCADPSWQLYIGRENYFCCLPDQKGALPPKTGSGIGLCVASDMSLAITQVATKATSQTGSPSSSTGAGASSGAATSGSSQSSQASSAATPTSASTAAQSSPSAASANAVQVESPFALVVGCLWSLLMLMLVH